MHVKEALDSRITCRAFLPEPVPRSTVEAILDGARRAPSGGNLQPWWVWALAGKPLAELTGTVAALVRGGQLGDGPPEYSIYPHPMKEPYIGRKYLNGQAVYAALGVERDDEVSRNEQIARNFEFFGAPVGIFFAIDRDMQQGQWSDLGMYIMAVMLLARENGLHTAPLESWALFPRTVARFVDMPENLMLFCGLALGHMDPDHPVNAARVPRADTSEFAKFAGFEG